MINSGETAFGGFTLRVVRSRLGKEEQMGIGHGHTMQF